MKKSPAKKPAPKKGAKAASAKRGSSSSKSKRPVKKAGARPAKKRTVAAKKPPRVVRKSKRPALRAKPKAKAAKNIVIRPPVALNEEALRLARLVANAASEKKALDVMILDTRRKGASVGYDYVVLATAESDRQLDALADAAREAGKTKNRTPSGVESSPDWVLVNFDDVVVHFFTPDKRGTYDIEGLWADAPRVEVMG